MRTLLLTLLTIGLAAFAKAQQVNLDGGPEFGQLFGGTGVSVGASALLQISDLRAYYGLRAEVGGERGQPRGYFARPEYASVILAYKAFPFDLEGDCNCPTWGRESWFEKHFFVEAGLGYARVRTYVDGKSSMRGGLAYLGRAGLSVRASGPLEVYLAGSLHGYVHRDRPPSPTFPTPELPDETVFRIGLQPILGLTYRWPTRTR